MFQRQPAYVSPIHAVERVRVRAARRARTRPDFVVLYALAAVAGTVFGLVLSILG